MVPHVQQIVLHGDSKLLAFYRAPESFRQKGILSWNNALVSEAIREAFPLLQTQVCVAEVLVGWTFFKKYVGLFQLRQ